MQEQKTYDFLQKLCKKYKVFPKQVLELTCENGGILEHFAEQSKVYGIDNSETKIEEAKISIPTGKFYRQNLSNFRIPFQGQLIYCINTNFNQLTKYSDREKVFTKASGHLEPYGLFIFRILTEKYYQTFGNQSSIIESNGKYTITQTNKSKKNIYSTHNKIFTNTKDNIYTLSESSICEISFPISQIKKSLQQHFENIFTSNIKGQKVKPSDGEIYIICQKGRE